MRAAAAIGASGADGDARRKAARPGRTGGNSWW